MGFLWFWPRPRRHLWLCFVIRAWWSLERDLLTILAIKNCQYKIQNYWSLNHVVWANHGLQSYANQQQPCNAPSPLLSCWPCSCASLKAIEITQVSPLSRLSALLAHKKGDSREFRGNRVHMYVLTPHARPACHPSKTRHPPDCRFDPTSSADVLRVIQPGLWRIDMFLSQKHPRDSTLKTLWWIRFVFYLNLMWWCWLDDSNWPFLS